jgi:DNA-binding transcriptional LysR family regulator
MKSAMQPPPWSLLNSFLHVADAGSLSAAARGGRISQPTLSRHVEALERQLGVPLFNRTGRGLKLTPAGMEVLSHARTMQEEAAAVATLASRRAVRIEGTVRITTSEVLGTYVLPAILAALVAEHRDLVLDVRATDAVDNLLDGEADIALRVTKPAQNSLVGRNIGQLIIGAYAHEDYLRAHSVPKTREDLSGHKFVGEASGNTIEAALRRLGLSITAEHFVIRTDSQALRWNAVCAGAGIGFIATIVGDTFAHQKVRRVLPDIAHVLPLWIVARRDVRSLKRVRTVFDAIAAAVRQLT